MAFREFAASYINFHKEFSIPKTILININGWIGYAQFFLENAKKLKEIKNETILIKSMQALIIFDLLFGNMDRHEDNFLFLRSENGFIPYGIDHDSTMQGVARDKIKHQYPNLVTHQKIFPDLIHLISDNYLTQYKQKMIDCGLTEDAIEWMNAAAKVLNKAFVENLPIHQALKKVISKWENIFLVCD